MFWKFDLNTTSHVDKLLDKEHVTLQELMDEDDILQECKAQNQKLLDFLCRQQCMEELVNLITQDPPLDMEEKISDRLGEDESLLNLLYDFLDQEPPLNPLLASFFSKTIGNLIARKTEQVIMFLKKKEKFISLMLKHIGTSALMDLLLRLVSCVEPVGLRQEVLHRQSNASQALCDIIRLGRDQGSQLQEAVEPDPLLITLESQDCVEQLLKNMFDGDQMESCLVSGMQVLLALLEPRRVGRLGGLLFSGTGKGILCQQQHPAWHRAMAKEFPSAPAPPAKGSPVLITPYSLQARHIIGEWPICYKTPTGWCLLCLQKKAILTTIGVLEEPLGNARLHGARLMAALLHTNTPSINQELCRLNTMDLLLDLFFKYTWNNFLHFQVELCIAAILSHASREEQAEASGSDGKVEPLQGSGDGTGKPETPQSITSLPENTMVTHLFQKCCLVQRILEAWEANDHTQAAGGMRRGNMGHLTRIANAVVQNLEQGPVQTHISEVIRGLPADCRGRWESFVEETLMETNRRNTVDLVSTHHLHSSSEDEDIEGTFPNELSLQQAFSEYQIQQMTANFVDQFGFNDEEFADQDDNINAPFDRIAEINFNVEADEDSPSAALFEACCSDRIQPFDDDEEEDIWEDEETRCTARVMARARFGAPHVLENYSKNALEHGGQDRKAGLAAARNVPGLATPSSPTQKEGPRSESDSEGTTWTAVFDEPVNPMSAAPGAARDVGSSIWAAGPSAPEEKGWAKFTDFQPFCCSESGPRCSSPVDMDHSHAEGGQSPGPEKAFGPTSPCTWNVCVTRKAPLVASDSSSSGGSDSEDDEKAAGAVEAMRTGHGGKAPPLPRTEEAAASRTECTDSTVLAPACPASPEVTISPAVATTAPSKAGPPAATAVVSSSVAIAVPPGPVMAVTTAAPAIVATQETMTKDRKTDALPEGAALNGPV
ncbi:serine/threonine-protein phosphatase 6 regulatory subunit 2 isoform X2 [Alexandromys fortis]|uniref:serine/threonine-protein phosphatase 6 regulatory subunit 2 isoform X2 n=1 Tax=Alexandromys fortis TaxID=100897 RepID=UPI0021537404|nr:serine/threonine-protein phosphatase 6 regulatory subunit 2 isoform X2 [Microtus fortis]